MIVYNFYSELDDYKPKIWRRFQVRNNITVARLAYIVMTMYEMTASHLLSIEHERPYLTATGRPSKRMELLGAYDIPGSDGDCDCEDYDAEDATSTKLSDLNLEAPSQLVVVYDFGDNWRVLVALETEYDDPALTAKDLPRVLEGKGFGIVEDCGGVPGLADLAQAFKKKSGEEYEEFRDWLGVDDLDLTKFDLDDMNYRVKKLPAIYAKIYEQHDYPSQRDIDLIERKYRKKTKKRVTRVQVEPSR
jgi:hypothetical protein